MSRNRVIYQSESLYVSKEVNSTITGDHHELIRVQSANYGFTINRQDVNQYGNLARIDSLVLEPPTVNFDFSYYLTDGLNEKALGFDISNNAQFVSGFLETSSGKNFYILTSEEGQDSTTMVGQEPYSLIGIGNAFLSDYIVDLSVGSLPTASVTFEGSNSNSQNGVVSGTAGAPDQPVTGFLPAVNPESKAKPFRQDDRFPDMGLDHLLRILCLHLPCSLNELLEARVLVEPVQGPPLPCCKQGKELFHAHAQLGGFSPADIGIRIGAMPERGHLIPR